MYVCQKNDNIFNRFLQIKNMHNWTCVYMYFLFCFVFCDSMCVHVLLLLPTPIVNLIFTVLTISRLLYNSIKKTNSTLATSIFTRLFVQKKYLPDCRYIILFNMLTDYLLWVNALTNK